MSRLNISLPEAMRAFVEEQVSDGRYSTPSEYIRQLIREAQERTAHQRLEQLLLDGLDSGDPVEVTDEWWAEKRARLEERIQSRQSRPSRRPSRGE